MELLDQPLRIAVQLHAHAGGQAHGARTVAVVEVVDVAPIVGGLLCGGNGFEILADRGVFAERARPERKQVEAVALDADAELQRLDRTGLTQHLGQRREFGRGLEAKLGRIAAASKRLRFQRLGRHDTSPIIGGSGPP